MAGSKARLLTNPCPNCESQGFNGRFYLISFRGNHGEEFDLEKHCNQCGYTIGAEGELRNPGRNYGVSSIEIRG